ncbi:MAG: hypothetical protein AB1758_14130, partial [Candidatus Eremiobacterota bacterium]
MGELPIDAHGETVEQRFRRAMAGLLRRLQPYDSEQHLGELYQKYGGAANGARSPATALTSPPPPESRPRPRQPGSVELPPLYSGGYA